MKDVEIYIDIALFNIIDSNVKVLLENNNIIRRKVTDLKSIDDCAKEILTKYINNGVLKQCYTYTKIVDKKMVLDILYIGIINKDINLNFDSIDKCNNKIIESAFKYFKEEINKIEILKNLYSEFSLPELQRLCYNIYGVEIDRRNFRKRLIKLNIIENLNKISDNKKGRPSKLYKFKDNIEIKYLL